MDENNLGTTYSVAHYHEYNLTNNKNLFEEVIDEMMLGELVIPQEIKDKIKDLPIERKRMNILSFLDEDRYLFTKIKALIEGSKISKTEHILDVVEMLRTYVKVGEVDRKNYGEVMTPIELVDEMLDTLPKEVWSDPTLKWLDPANGVGTFPAVVIKRLMEGLEEWEPDEDIRYRHIIDNMIYVTELQPKNMFLYLCLVDPFDTNTCNIYTGSFLDDGFDKHMKEVWGVDKFDIVIGNPPYNQNMDIKFTRKSHSISEQILFVHPSTWLLDEKLKHKGFIKIRDLLKDDLRSVLLFNGNPIFNIGLFVPCSVTHIDKSYDGKIRIVDKINDSEIEYSDIFMVNKYNTKEYLSLKNKISRHGDYISDYLDRDLKYWVNLSQIRGHVNTSNIDDKSMLKDDFYTLVTKVKKVELTKRIQPSKTQYSFNTEIEANNFLNYIKTKFARFCLSIYKNNANCHRGEVNLIPWLDFTQEWTDDKLRAKFNITEDEWEFINSVIPNYY